jgi:hypothetical protein
LANTKQGTSQLPEVALSDPCQYKERGSTTICGFQGKSLGPHLKAHKIAGKTLTVAQYKKKYKGFSLGAPSYSPPPEAVKRFLDAAPANQNKPAPPTDEEKAAKTSEYEAAIQARMEELWSMCERDPAARMIAMAAAKDEALLDDAYDEAEKVRASKKWEDLKHLNSAIEAITSRLNKNMTSLSLTVDQRRKSNTLGTDSVSQIICGYANTLRKMSPEKQEAFQRRVSTVENIIYERIRVSLLDEVQDDFDKAEKIVDEDDFRAAILRFNPDTN